MNSRIWIYVTTAHLAALAALIATTPAKVQKSRIERLVVKQVKLTPPAPPAPTKHVAVATPPAKKEVAKPTDSPKQEVAKPTAPSKKATKPAPPQKKKGISAEALKRAQESIAKIDATTPTATKKAAISSSARPLRIDLPAQTKAEQTPYSLELAKRLELALHLPEYGEVRIELTLNRDGKVASLTVVESHSRKNRDYVVAELPKLSFPSFGKEFAGQTEHTFSLNLSNA